MKTDCAATCAIPAPIVPAPQMQIVLIICVVCCVKDFDAAIEIAREVVQYIEYL